MPQRRQIKAIPMKEVKIELDDIEVQQQELERQGVTLEKTIRDKFDQAAYVNDGEHGCWEKIIILISSIRLQMSMMPIINYPVVETCSYD